MKIFTRLEFMWDELEATAKLIDCDCFDYEGPLALCTGVEEGAAVAGSAKGAAELGAAGMGAAEMAGVAGATIGSGGGFLGGVGAATVGAVGAGIADMAAYGSATALTMSDALAMGLTAEEAAAMGVVGGGFEAAAGAGMAGVSMADALAMGMTAEEALAAGVTIGTGAESVGGIAAGLGAAGEAAGAVSPVVQAAPTIANFWQSPEAMSSIFGLGDSGVAGTAGLNSSSSMGLFGVGSEGVAGAVAPETSGLASMWGKVTDAAKVISPIASLGSSLYGMEQQAAMKKAALAAQSKLSGTGTGSISAADSWGSSGGRAVADTQLQSLLNDPTQISASDPAYALRIQGAQRATASSGQDSGAMAVAGANASTTWYNERLAQLASLAGASNTTGANATSLALQAANTDTNSATAANTLASQSLASLGYGLSNLTGAATMPAAVRQWMVSQGLMSS